MNDVYGKPAILLRVQIPRDITAQGNVSAHVATAMRHRRLDLLTLVATWVVLKWRIVGPLQYMAAHAVRVGQADDLKARLQFDRTDEIGTLAREFDGMVENLAESRKKVLDSAHRAGMAEIASEVLHNVGNAVNSANCSVEVLEERFGGSKIGGLDRAVTLLREQAPRAAEFFGQDPRGAKLIDYLVNLNDTLRQEYSGNQAEVVRLRETIRHIRGAIAEQQTYAGRSDFRQEVDLSALLDEVLRLNQEQLRAAEIQVRCRSAAAAGTATEQEQDDPGIRQSGPQRDSRDAGSALRCPSPDDCGRRCEDGGIEIEVQRHRRRVSTTTCGPSCSRTASRPSRKETVSACTTVPTPSEKRAGTSRPRARGRDRGPRSAFGFPR